MAALRPGQHAAPLSILTLSVPPPQGTAQVSLADCEGAAEMVYHWLRVQMLAGAEFPKYEAKNLSHRRHHDSPEDEQRPRMMVKKCILGIRWR